MRYPVVWSAIAFGAGLWLSQSGYFPGFGPTLLLTVAAFPCAILLRRLPHIGVATLLFCFLGCGLLYAAIRLGGPPGDPLFQHAVAHRQDRYVLEGVVMQSPLILPESSYERVHLRVDRVLVNGEPTPLYGMIALRWSDPVGPLFSGERIRASGQLNPLLGPVNFGIGGVEVFLRTQGIHTAMTLRGADAVETVATPRFSPRYWAARLRYYQAGIFSRTLPESVQPFIHTVWLGARGGIPDDTYEAFLNTGTAHILAVSGVHVAIVFISSRILFGIFVRSPKKLALITSLAVLTFALVAGARISSLRAAFMIILYQTAEYFDREPHAPTALALAAFTFLLHNPALLFDTAFLLSFSSVASLLLFSDRIFQWLPSRWPRGLRRSLASILGVQILPTPFAAHFFHVLPLLGPVANFIVMPLLTFILWLCPLIVLCGSIYEPLGRLFGHAIEPLLACIHATTGLLQALPGAYQRLSSPTAFGALCFWAAAACLFKALERKDREL